MILNSHFDNIYVPYIYEKELTNIKWKFDELNLQVQYFKGYNGLLFEKYDNFLKNQQQKKKIDQSIILLTKGQYGHITTFIEIFKDAIKNGYNKILILEPDVYLVTDIEERYKQYTELDYKILYLGASQNYYYKEKTWEKIDITKNYYGAYKTLGTFAIAFDKSIFSEILKILGQYNVPTDIALFELQNKYNNIYVCYPNIICCNVINSTTSGIRSNKIIQTERMDDCKWTLKYDTREKLIIKTNNNPAKLTLHINSKLCDYNIDINCDYYMEIINDSVWTIKIIPNNKNIIIIIFKDIFMDKIEIQ